jgi:phosphohistidine phosphatase
MSDDPFGWLGDRLADLDGLLAPAGFPAAAAGPGDAESLRAAAPEIVDVTRRLLGRVRDGELGRDAPKIGRWLREHGYLPEVVICSAARRTRQTWDLVARELGGSPSVTFEPRAYAASATTLLYLVMELPATSRTALLVGHNPGVAELATSLALPPDGDDAPIRFPTAAVAVLDFPGDWADLTPGQARLTDFTIPADL